MGAGGGALSPLWLAASSAASTASTAAAGGRPGFDPASTLGWSVPLLLLAPLLGFLLLVTGVRSRRAAANLAALAGLVTLAACLLVGWARFKRDQPYVYSFPWISISPSFTGASQFQTFQVDVSFRVDHVALAALAVVSLVFLVCMYWNRGGGRADSGPVRLHVLALLLLFCSAGVVVAGDLVELFGFWALAGVASWLLLAHRWGIEPAASASRLALSVPVVGDVSLLLGVGLLHSRFGVLDMDKLYAVLHTTPGVGLKTLTAACVLIFVGVAARAALFPFTAWQTATLEAPPALAALVQGVWPVLAGVLLFRTLPLFAAAGPQAFHVAAYWAAAAALVAGGLALAGNDLRRSICLVGAAACGLGVLAVVSSSGAVGVAVLLCVGIARPGLWLSSAAVAAAMRTFDLAETGDGWRRMRRSALALSLSGVAISLAGAVAGAWRGDGPNWHSALVFVAVVFVGLGAGRAWFAISTGPLRRRRAFEPDRVRDPVPLMSLPALAAGVLAVAALVLAFLTPWVRFLARIGHPAPAVGTYVLWAAGAALGLALAAAFGLAARDRALRGSAGIGLRLGGYRAGATAVVRTYLTEPGLRLVDGFERGLLARGEGALGASVSAFGGAAGLAAWRPPLVPALLLVIVVVAVAVGVLAPGFVR